MAKRIHDVKNNKAFRKELRNAMTPSEAFLWNQLKHRKLMDRKFRRQHGIERFIVDFYCYEEKLIIELDGQGHNTPYQMAYDERRTERLEELGNTVLRFENKMVFDQLTSVLKEIVDCFGRSTTSTPT